MLSYNPLHASHRQREFIKWLLLFALAGALAMAFATGQAAGEATKPALLPESIQAQPTLPDKTPSLAPGKAAPLDYAPMVMHVWKALALHRPGDVEEARGLRWRWSPTPRACSNWRLAWSLSDRAGGSAKSAASDCAP